MGILLLADEQEDMIDHYLEDDEIFVLSDPEVVGECVVCDLGECGVTDHHRVKNFFIDNYDHPSFHDGIQLVDMVYLRYDL